MILCHHQTHLQAKTEGKSSAVELRKNPYTSHLQLVVVEKDVRRNNTVCCNMYDARLRRNSSELMNYLINVQHNLNIKFRQPDQKASLIWTKLLSNPFMSENRM